jgi:transcriptional regulator with XRE-family HTH domain
MITAEKIRNARKSIGMSQTTLAERLHAFGLGTHQETISRWESGRSIPSDMALSALSEILECHFDESRVFIAIRTSAVNLLDEMRADLTRTQFLEKILSARIWLNYCENESHETEAEDYDD